MRRNTARYARSHPRTRACAHTHKHARTRTHRDRKLARAHARAHTRTHAHTHAHTALQVLMANAWHHRSDALSSLVAIGAIGGSLTGMPYMDPLGGVLVSLLVGKAGVEIGWGAVKTLTDQQNNERVIAG